MTSRRSPPLNLEHLAAQLARDRGDILTGLTSKQRRARQRANVHWQNDSSRGTINTQDSSHETETKE